MEWAKGMLPCAITAHGTSRSPSQTPHVLEPSPAPCAALVNSSVSEPRKPTLRTRLLSASRWGGAQGKAEGCGGARTEARRPPSAPTVQRRQRKGTRRCEHSLGLIAYPCLVIPMGRT